VKAAVIGGGPAGLMAAETMANAGLDVTVFEHKRSTGRKLLLAGRSGLNLTNDEDVEQLLARYIGGGEVLERAIRAFPPVALRSWAEELGSPTFVGSTGRVFPEEMRATPLLRAWLVRLGDRGVEFRTDHRFLGWEGRALRLTADGEERLVEADTTVLAMGGASWPKVGSDGGWVAALRTAGVQVNDLVASNCGVVVGWSEHFVERFAGTPLKNVRLTVGTASERGDPVVTTTGLESGPVYALGPAIREQLSGPGSVIYVDLQPDRSIVRLADHLAVRRRPKDSRSTWLKRAGLPPAAISLLREATNNKLPDDVPALASLIKAVPVEVTGFAPIDRAISSAGGVAMDEVDEHFMLHKMPGTYAVGEMLDWDAPTGGYLLQACFSMGRAAGAAAVERLRTL